MVIRIFLVILTLLVSAGTALAALEGPLHLLLLFDENQSPLACDGVIIGGNCWWFGQNNQSCDQVCSGKGGYNDATRIYAGSGGTDANCNQVLQGLGISQQQGCIDIVNRPADGLGCAADFEFEDNSCKSGGSSTIRFVRYTDTTSSSNTGTYIRRACACNEQPQPNSLSYTGSPFTFNTCVAITLLAPSVINYVREYSVSPVLPAGLSIDTTTGIISGTPTGATGSKSYTVFATNDGGFTATSITINVVQHAPSGLSYAGSPFTFTAGEDIGPQKLPSVTGCVDSYSIAPSLPGGLFFDTSTGAISGTPSSAQSATSYTVTATNSSGYDEFSISIEIVPSITCSGTVAGGACWYLGSNNQSCDDVCESHEGYNGATKSYAGSSGSNAGCADVMTALRVDNFPHPYNPTPVSEVSSLGGISGLGCGSDYTGDATTYRLTSATTSSASSLGNSNLYFRRACACNE
jgi:hypothetical protein